MLDRITWPAVVALIAVLAAVVILSLNHADVSVIGTMLVLLGLGSVAGVVSGIKSNVNGNLKQMVEMIGTAMERLAAAPATPTPDSQPSTTDTPKDD